MQEKSRTEYSAKNTTVAVVSRFAAMFMGFILRIVFTHTLSEDYVGVDGLFTDIINILSLTELGVGTAITYALYGPIQQKDIETQKSLMKFFQKFYHGVAAVVLVIGLLLVPFLDVLIKEEPKVDYLILIYLMYLLNSVLSYFIIYKKTLLDAHQLSYIGILYKTVGWMIKDVFQILVLIFTHNFILYVLLLLISTVLSNILISKKADAYYPYLKDKNVRPLEKAEKADIIKNVKAMLMHKVGNVVVSNTDNLLLSAFVGIVAVGKYSNYYMIIGSLKDLLLQVYQGIIASVGNLGVSEDAGRIHRVFRGTFFITQWMSVFVTICIYELIDGFVYLFFGEQYVFDSLTVSMLAICFFVTSMRNATLVFRDSLGLFYFDRYKSIVEAVLNLVISLFFVTRLGAAGVFLGTILSTLLTSFWVEPYVLYKHRLKKKVVEYFLLYGVYTFVGVVSFVVTHELCKLTPGYDIFSMCCRLIFCVAVPNLIMFISYVKTKDFNYVLNKGLELYEKKKMKEKVSLSNNQRVFLQLIKEGLKEYPGFVKEVKKADKTDFMYFYEEGKRQSLQAILYNGLEACADKGIEDAEQILKRISSEEVNRTLGTYHLYQETDRVVKALENAGLSVVVLKGSTVGSFYEMPEYRKSGDIDLWLKDVDSFNHRFNEAAAVLEDMGYQKDESMDSLYHVGFKNSLGLEVELHIKLTGEFSNKKLNSIVEEFTSSLRNKKIGIVRILDCYEFPSLEGADLIYYNLLHMLHHFTTKGFGWKFICDWAMMFKEDLPSETKIALFQLLENSKLLDFAEAVSLLAVNYLGLEKEKVEFLISGSISDEVIVHMAVDIFEAGEFGSDNKGSMLRPENANLFGMVKLFYQQVKKNYPRAYKVIPLWIVLWPATLFKFMYNNKHIRNVSTTDVLKNAKNRGKTTERLNLYKR